LKHLLPYPEFIIEEFLSGSEHSIEGIVIDGKIYWAAVSDRNYDKKEMYPPYFLEDGDTLPSSLTPAILDKVIDVSSRAVRALGIKWGPVKGDILVDADGPKVIEMAARLSGDYFCHETIPLHNGINLLSIVIDLSLGLQIDPDRLKPAFNRGVALRYIWPKPGIVEDIKGVEKVRAMKGVHFFNWEPRWKDIKKGTRIFPPQSMGERVGCVMTYADSRDEAINIAEKSVSMVKIVTN